MTHAETGARGAILRRQFRLANGGTTSRDPLRTVQGGARPASRTSLVSFVNRAGRCSAHARERRMPGNGFPIAYGLLPFLQWALTAQALLLLRWPRHAFVSWRPMGKKNPQPGFQARPPGRLAPGGPPGRGAPGRRQSRNAHVRIRRTRGGQIVNPPPTRACPGAAGLRRQRRRTAARVAPAVGSNAGSGGNRAPSGADRGEPTVRSRCSGRARPGIFVPSRTGSCRRGYTLESWDGRGQNQGASREAGHFYFGLLSSPAGALRPACW